MTPSIRTLAVLALALTVTPGLAAPQKAKDKPAPVTPAEDYCGKYQSGSNVVLLFIDRTDPLLAREKDNVSKAAKAALALLQPGWRLQALVIADQALPKRAIFDNCMPGNEKSLIGTIIDKPQRGHALEYDVEVIKGAYGRAIETEIAIPHGGVKKSAIAAVLSTVSGAAVEKRRTIKAVIIASDLLDNDVLGFPRPAPLSRHDEEMADEMLRRDHLYATLSGAPVNVFGFGYFDGSQPAVNGERPALPRNIAVNLDRFWKAYFGRSGAGQVTFE